MILLDPNFRPDGALVAELDGEQVGFLQAMVRRVPLGIQPTDPKQGWITVFFVAAEQRRRRIGRKLMDAGLSYLRESGCQVVTCNGYAPSYAFPGVDFDYAEALVFMRASGFEPLTEAIAMDLSLVGLEKPQPVIDRQIALEAEGIYVRRFKACDTIGLLALAEKYFPYWHQSVVDGLQQDRRNVFVAVRGEDVLGFAQWENPHTDPPSGAPGRFGPFGIRPDLRSNGLGAALFYSVIEQVDKRGADRLWFGWAGGRNLSFYERAGCQVTRRYQIFRRKWSADFSPHRCPGF